LAASDRAAVLVTGGAGYIGSHVCLALHEAGYLPVTFDDLSGGHRWAVRWGPLVVGDIRDRAAIVAGLAQWRCEAVMHLAGRISVAESVANPQLYYDVNVHGSVQLCEAMGVAGVEQLVFSSSAAVYGDGRDGPIPESSPIAPRSPYGENKAEFERRLAHVGNLRCISLRYFNAAGADPTAGIGEAHEPETHLIPLALAAARAGTQMTIFGDDYPTRDGSCIRDYVHVKDIADAHVAAMRRLRDLQPGNLGINLGTGSGASVREVLNAVQAVTGKAVPVQIAPRRAGDPASLVASNTCAQAELGWRPQRSALGSVIADAWRWMQVGERLSAPESAIDP
jgi:UDP-arabinose 4-epimerase